MLKDVKIYIEKGSIRIIRPTLVSCLLEADHSIYTLKEKGKPNPQVTVVVNTGETRLTSLASALLS